MATLKTYVCKKCGYEVRTVPKGHYSLMLGEFYNYLCSHCEEIVTLSETDVFDKEILLRTNKFKCPDCNEDSLLLPWNPIRGRCPKCNSVMKENKRCPIVAAD